jgi:hypothetical protein
MTEEPVGFTSEYDRLQEQWNARYHLVHQGLRWHVKCGTGTRSLMAFFRKTKAERAAAEMLTAFRDGMFVANSKFRGGGRYA